MLNYLPEPIYKGIERDTDLYLRYMAILEDLELERERCRTLADWIKYDNPSYVDSREDLKKIIGDIDDLIMSKYGDSKMVEAYKILNNKYDLKGLEKIYDDIRNERDGYSELDKEVLYDLRSICLDAIIEYKYINGSYLDYMAEHVRFYEALDKEILEKCTTFTHMKYMKAAIQLFATDNKDLDWQRLCNYMDAVYETVTEYKNTDTIKDAYVECVVDFLNILRDHKDILKIISHMHDKVMKLTYQYEEYSYGKAALYMVMCEIYLANDKTNLFMTTLETLVKYVNNSLSNIQMLIRGLTVFDKINTHMYISIIRWILRLNNEIPFIKRNGICKLTNLQMDDYDLIMGDIEEINKNNKGRDFICSAEFSKGIDRWFNSNNDLYMSLKKL